MLKLVTIDLRYIGLVWVQFSRRPMIILSIDYRLLSLPITHSVFTVFTGHAINAQALKFKLNNNNFN